MATLALSLAGQAVGGLVGGPIGATIGRALGALAGSAIDNAIFGETPQNAPADIRLQGSSEGGAVPRLYGWSRLAGNIIWARELERLGGDSAGAKGLGQSEADEVGASFAVAFCEGEVHRLGRIWADGQLLDTSGLTLRFYRGTQTQLPDGLIEATQGVAPAYRGLCYLVVENLPLSRFGNRIPQLSVELCRVVGELEPQIRAVTLIPGATEFGYDPVPRLRLLGPGASTGENIHVPGGGSDWSWSIDELTALCPNLRHVALVVAWFGDDLRCGQCQITPRVEGAVRPMRDTDWSVMGLGRGDVPVVTSHAGGAAYGGTPSDHAVRAAIADLKARGLGVTLYPLIMMDIAAGNSLPNPYGGTGQPAYPWRGRITCDPAPGQAGSPHLSAAASAQVADFAARYRSMVLHYAGLAASAGGVDAFIIGSEMVALTGVRGPGTSFPFVDALVGLASEVRSVVGPATRLTYAADWSEYSGVQAGGEKFFHLDPLWASAAIDAVGIDNYMPLADWRDGTGHLDAADAASPYGLDYLSSRIAGGEGFDWYYASDADRQAQIRTPITDGAYGEPWVWRYKDIRNWWSQPHHDRPGGVRNGAPTAWVPASKPIWLTELGCGAVDKGANQPNIFGDPKSAESGRPHFSSGLPDPLMQRQLLRAHQAYWRDGAHNPPGMVDVDRLYLWSWDARPYPAFPARLDVWSDGTNHRAGHWLTGRLGGLASDELAQVLAAEHGVALKAEPALPFVSGYALNAVGTARAALEPLLAATGQSIANRSDGLWLARPRPTSALTVAPEHLAQDEGPVLARKRSDPAEVPGRLALSFIDRERDYLGGAVTALALEDGPLATETLPLVLDGTAARLAAERLLDAQGGRIETLELALPPNALQLEPGDLLAIAGIADGPFEITDIRDGATRRISARSLPRDGAVASAPDRPLAGGSGVKLPSVPLLVAAHLPPLPDDPGRSRLVVGGHATPWPGTLQLADTATGANLLTLERGAVLGETATALGLGPSAVWDCGTAFEVILYAGHLASVTPEAALAGSNRLAVETDAGRWEVIGFVDAVLVAPGRYRLSQLLRGLEGSGPAMGPIAAGRRVMLLDGRVASLPLAADWLGETRSLRAYAGSDDATGTALEIALDAAPALPLPPVHLRAQRLAGGDIALGWQRCSRADGAGWGLLDVPLEHMPERYSLSIANAGLTLRTLEVAAPSAIYSLADQTSDFGGPAAGFDFSVAQISPLLGAGHAATGVFHG